MRIDSALEGLSTMLHNRRIFVVEDNLENRIITRILLSQEGAQVEFDNWGREALARLKRFAPVDIILLDLMLANGYSGYTIFDQIRANPAFASVPIVAVSAADPVASIRLCQDKGFAGFIPKPIHDELFPQQIAEIILGKSVWIAGAAP